MPLFGACLLDSRRRPHFDGTAQENPEQAVEGGSLALIEGLQEVPFVRQGERCYLLVDGFPSLGEA